MASCRSRSSFEANHPNCSSRHGEPLFQAHNDVFFELSRASTDEGTQGSGERYGAVDRTLALATPGWLQASDDYVDVTGNFVIDPAWDEEDFESLWAFERSAYDILSGQGLPCLDPDIPGTPYFEKR